MRVLVTAGGTREYIDDVHVLANISSGKLGAKIVEEFMDRNHDVIYIHPRGAVLPNRLNFRQTVIDVIADSADQVFKAMKKWVPQVDVVIHSMAISDFGFNRDNSVKLESNDPEAFIKHMRANIKINPKIITFVKEWNPDVVLVGFKFEVGKSLDELLEIAREFMKKSGADFIVANDKAEMTKYSAHIAYLITEDTCAKMYNKPNIAETLRMYLEHNDRRKNNEND